MPDTAPTPPDAPGHKDIDADSRAELDALLAGLEAARPTKIGFPDATDVDYTDLAPFLRFLLNNLGDPQTDGLYPWHTKPQEREVVGMVAELLRAPDHRWGYVTATAGEGTEWALWQARRRYPDAIVYTSTAAHHATDAATDRLAMPTVSIRTDPYGQIDYDDLAGQLDHHRLRPTVVVANIGTTWHEAVDDVRRIRAILDELAIRRRWVHCDAALSGLPLALTDPDQRPGMDFADGADSIVVSGHKLFGTPVPCGVLVVRGGLRDQGRTVTYTGAADATLSNSRPGLAALALWYALHHQGTDGLRTRVDQARQVAAHLHGRLVGIGWPQVHRHRHGFTVTLATPPAAVAAKWCMPDLDGSSHIICMPGITRDQVDAFIRDLVASRDVAAASTVDPPAMSTVGERQPRRALRRALLSAPARLTSGT